MLNYAVDKLEDLKLWLYFDVYQELVFFYKTRKIKFYLITSLIAIILIMILVYFQYY